MDIKERFANKMMLEKLDFLPIEDAIELKESGVELPTRFHYVANIEELGGEHDSMSDKDIYETIDNMMGDYGYGIGDSNHFDEFTHKLAPAPTYIDLIK